MAKNVLRMPALLASGGIAGERFFGPGVWVVDIFRFGFDGAPSGPLDEGIRQNGRCQGCEPTIWLMVCSQMSAE